MTDLSNGAEWQKIYDQFHVAQPIPDQPGRHYPIIPIVIPAILDNYTVAISSKTTQFKPTWKLGAKVYQLIDVTNSDIDVAKHRDYYAISVNEVNIFKIKRFSTYYRLLIEVPTWFVDAHIEAWIYTGTDSIKSTDERLEVIEQGVARIETKIDSHANT